MKVRAPQSTSAASLISSAASLPFLILFTKGRRTCNWFEAAMIFESPPSAIIPSYRVRRLCHVC